MKFWSGFGGHESDAAWACVQGGWIPVSETVTHQPEFVQFLAEYPLFAKFALLAASPYQVPTPSVPAGPLFVSAVIEAAQDAIYRAVDPQTALERATRQVQARLDEVTRE